MAPHVGRRSVAIIGTRGYPSYYGGFETAVRKIAPVLADRGWDVIVYGRSAAIEAEGTQGDPRVRVITTPGRDSRALSTLSFGMTASISAAIRRPDVALIMNVANGFWLPILRAAGVRTAVNVDGIEWERDKWGGFARRVFRAGAWLTYKFANEIIYDAYAIERYWQDKFGRPGSVIAYGGDQWPELPTEPNLERGRYVLLVARLVPENTVGEFLEALRYLPRDREVVIVGSSGYGGELEARVRELSNNSPSVTWLGHIDDDRRLAGLWQNAGVYFHGHSVGGTNPALVQAMACGSPIVARDTVYNREVLGEAGVLCAANPREIARQLEEVLEDESARQSLSTMAMRRALALYSWEGVADAYDGLLSRLESVG